MNGNCLEIGIIQAFLDGETTPDQALRISGHVADCDKCAILMADAEEESSMVFSVLGREMDTLVPTQRLWGRINESIAVEKSRMPVWRKFLGFVSVNLASPSIAVAASVLIIFGLFAVVTTFRTGDGTVANGPGDIPVAPNSANPNPQVVPINGEFAKRDESDATDSAPTVVHAKKSNLNDAQLQRLVVKASQNTAKRPTPEYAVVNDYIPGEESYVKTISDLKQNVDVQKDTVLTPSSRVAYERDMAVVNDSITKMKEVVRKNPKNQSAKQVLYSSYQDKIDLLNSVAQREELLASVR